MALDVDLHSGGEVDEEERVELKVDARRIAVACRGVRVQDGLRGRLEPDARSADHVDLPWGIEPKTQWADRSDECYTVQSSLGYRWVPSRMAHLDGERREDIDVEDGVGVGVDAWEGRRQLVGEAVLVDQLETVRRRVLESVHDAASESEMSAQFEASLDIRRVADDDGDAPANGEGNRPDREGDLLDRDRRDGLGAFQVRRRRQREPAGDGCGDARFRF
eukprot:1048477-Prymnesium_polylepis.1